MKRKNNLYENIYVIKHIEEAFNEVCRNTKNKILCEISRWCDPFLSEKLRH